MKTYLSDARTAFKMGRGSYKYALPNWIFRRLYR